MSSADCQHDYHAYSVLLPDGVERAEAQSELQETGVITGIDYPVAVAVPLQKVHDQSADGGTYQAGEFPLAEIAARPLCLPMFPEMTEGQQDHVVASLKVALQRKVA